MDGKRTNDYSNSSAYEAFRKAILSMSSRLPQEEFELLARQMHSAVSSPKSPGHLFNFAAFINPNMMQDTFDDLITGMMANFQRVMTSKKYRLPVSSAILAPPLSGPAPNITLGSGDVDAALSALADASFSGDLRANGVRASLEGLKRTRETIRNDFKRDPKAQELVITLGKVVMCALRKAAMKDEGFIQTLSDELRRNRGKKPVIVIDPDKDYKILDEDSSYAAQRINGEGEFVQGGIPVVYKIIKAVIDYGPLIIDLYKMFVKNHSLFNTKVDFARNTYAAPQIGKLFVTLANNASVAKLPDVAKEVSLFETEFKNLDSKLAVGNQLSANATDWRALFSAVSIPRCVYLLSMELQNALALAYKAVNPERTELINLLIPRNNVPLGSLMMTPWSPTAVSDQDMAWADFKEYYKGAVAVNPTISAFLKGKPIDSLEMTFKNGAPFFDNDKSIADGWDNVAAKFIKEFYPSKISKFLKLIKTQLNDAYTFSANFANLHNTISLKDVFPQGDYSTFKPWDNVYMKDFWVKIQDVYKARGVSQPTTSSDVPVTDPVTAVTDVPVVDPTVTTSQGVITGPTSGSDGAILITPNETIVGMGHYVDPETGKMNDYKDLYDLGREIKSLRNQATLYIKLPTPGSGDPLAYGDPLYGDPLTGGFLSAALNIGKNLLSKTKFGKKIIDKVSSIPILKNLIKSKPEAVSQLAQQSASRESSAAETLQSASGVPTDPTTALSYVDAAQKLSDTLAGINSKMDLVLAELSRIQFGQNSMAENLLTAGDPFSKIKYRRGLYSSVPVNFGELLSASIDGGNFGPTGDIDLWQVQP